MPNWIVIRGRFSPGFSTGHVENGFIGGSCQDRLAGSDPGVNGARSGPPANREDVPMKYMLLIYNNPETLSVMPQEELQAFMDEVDPIVRELTESGELVGGDALADPSNTTTVRVRDGVVAATDGPFAEAKEQLAGYLVIDCERRERALEIAARWPDARRWALEVRPVMNTAGTEM